MDVYKATHHKTCWNNGLWGLFTRLEPRSASSRRESPAAVTLYAIVIFFFPTLFNFLFPFPIWVRFCGFQQNKELLIGVGRRDFELGSAPVFPVVRVEIDLEEWHTQRSACPILRYSYTISRKKKKKKSFLNAPLAFTITCRRAEADRGEV